MTDSIDVDKLLRENRAKVLAELKQQDHSLGNGLQHVIAELGRFSENQSVLLRRVNDLDAHTGNVSREMSALRVSIAGDSALGVKGLGERVKAVEENSQKTNKRLEAFENKTKGGIWVVSALATIGGLAGTFLGLWIKSFKG